MSKRQQRIARQQRYQPERNHAPAIAEPVKRPVSDPARGNVAEARGQCAGQQRPAEHARRLVAKQPLDPARQQ
jgi:hypothetical protein